MPRSFDDLTQAQKKQHEAELKRFGLSPASDAVFDHARLFAAKRSKPERVVLSSDAGESDVTPHYLTLTSLDEVKSLVGISNEAIESGKMGGLSAAPPPPLAAGKRRKPAGELSEAERQQINRAAEHYIFGHSETVRSYKGPFEALRMPMRVAAFSSEDITVTPDTPLELKGPDPVTLVAGVITMEAGSEIIVETTAHITARVLQDDRQKSGEPKKDPARYSGKISVRGTDGTAGTESGNGNPGPAGARGTAARTSGKSCVGGGPGGKGGQGTEGAQGGEGGAGSSGNTLVFKVDTVDGVFLVESRGGHGGAGGKGGTGGQGGAGGPGGAAGAGCGGGPQGPGGDGGKGGKGGQGGQGGPGGNVVIYYQEYAPGANIIAQALQSEGGQPGERGQEGPAGKGSSPGQAGGKGDPGEPGERGEAVEIKIYHKA